MFGTDSVTSSRNGPRNAGSGRSSWFAIDGCSPVSPVVASPVVAVVVAIVMIAVAGCGGNTVGTQQVEVGATKVSGTLVPESPPTVLVSGLPSTPGAASAGPTAAQEDPPEVSVIVPDPTVVGLVPLPWQSATADPEDGRRIVVDFALTGGPCQVLGGVDLVETPADVTITLRAGAVPGQDCSGPRPSIATSAETVVILDAPLGGRSVRDGAVS